MKKSVLFAIFLLCGIMFVGCGHNVATGNGGGGGSSGEDPVEKIERMTYMGESTETIDGITYTVKSYAEVFGDPYFYNYYKYYYLNGKLRRVYLFYHSVEIDHGHVPALDYKYTEFVEHNCNGSFIMVWKYGNTGIKESATFSSNGIIERQETYYKNGQTKVTYDYNCGDLYCIYAYFSTQTASNYEKEYLHVYYPDRYSTSISFECYYESGSKHYSYDASTSKVYVYPDGSSTPSLSNVYTEQQLQDLIDSLISVYDYQ